MYPFRMKCYSVAPLFLASLWRPLPRIPLPLPPSASGESCCQVSFPAFRRQKRCLRVTLVGECQPPRDTQVTLPNIHLLSQHLYSQTCLVIWLTIFVPDTEGYAYFWKMRWFTAVFSRATMKAHWLHQACLSLGRSQECAPFVSKGARLHVSDSSGVL